MAPSAAPTPTMLCISSIKSSTFPAADTSASTFLTRSSKSPRYLVPATIAVRSSETNRFPLSPSGTCPAAILCASASTIAVFPTPASPIRHGLFFVLRQRLPHQPVQFCFPADDRVDFPCCRLFCQITGILIQNRSSGSTRCIALGTGFYRLLCRFPFQCIGNGVQEFPFD